MQQQSGQPASAGPGTAGAAAGGQGQPGGAAARPAEQHGTAASSTPAQASTAGSGGPAAVAATAAPARPSQPAQAATANPPRAGQPASNATTTPASNAATRPAASTAGTGTTTNTQPNLVVVSSGHPRSTPGGGLRPLNVKDALSYLDMVKAKFKGDPDTYNSFLDIMKDFKTQVIDTPGVIDRVSSLFRNHPTLISSFNLFLPEGYCIECLCDPDNRENITSYRVITPYTTQQLKAGQATSLAGTVLPGQVSVPNYGRPGGPARPAGQAAAGTAASTAPSSAAPAAGAAGQVSRAAAQGPAASTTAAAATAAAGVPASGAARVKTEPAAPAAPAASAAAAPVKREEQQPQQPKGPPAESAPTIRAMMPSNLSPSGRRIPRTSPPPPPPPSSFAQIKQPAATPALSTTSAPAPASANQRPAAATQNSGSNSSLAAPAAASAQGSRTATPGAASALSNSSDSRRPAIEFNHAISYVNKIKNRFQREPEIYKTFLDILQTYQKEQRPIQDVYKQVTSLFRTAPDLLDEFKQFLPDHSAAGQAAEAKAAAAAAQAAGRSGQARADEAAAAQKRKRAAGGPAQDRVPEAPLPGHPATLAPPPMRSQQIPQQHQQAAQKPVPGGKKVGKGAAAGVKDPPTIAQSSSLRYDGAPPTYPQPILSYLPPGYTLPGSGGSGMVSQGPPPQSQMTGDEHLFFDRVADFIDDKFTYYEFLKLLNLFTQDIIDLPTLVSRAWLFIGSAPDLWLDFRHLVGWQDGLNVNGRTIENGEWIVENTPVVERKTFDLSKAESAGPSYKRLPQSEINMHCSGRDKLCWEVLNDEWLSVMSMGSEEVFMAHRKNPFEEALHRSEDDRHEYDFHIEANLRTIALLEPIAGKIATMTPKERESFRLKPGLGGQSKSLYQRIIKKVYGKEIGREVIAALHENPCVSVPIVLARLKQKDEEWKRALREWNRVWREVDAKNFYRSLDHQGITFKAQDKRYINPKSLVTEIETLRRTEMQKQIAAPLPYRPPAATYQLSYPISDETVLFDSLKLFLSYLDRAPGYHTLAERDRIEAFLRSLTSLVFAIPVSVLDAMLTPVQDDDNSGSLSDDDISDSALSSVDGRQANGKKTGSAAGANASGKKLGDLRKKAMKNAGSGEAGSGAGKVRNGLEAAEMTPASSRDTTPVPPAAGEDTPMAGTTAAVDSTNGAASAAEQEANGESSFKTDVPASAAGLDAMTGVEVVRTAVASATQTIEQAQRPRTPSAHSLYDPNAPPETMQLAHDVVENGPMLPPPPTPPTASSSDSAGPTPPQAGQTTPVLHNAQRDGQHQIRRFNFFCNTPYYCAIRLLQLLYSRLHTMKECAKSLGSTASDNALNNSSYTKAGKANPRISGQETPTPSFLYDSMLELCEKLFGSEIDQPTFEDGVRNLFGNKSYHIFTIDKLLSSLVKTVWSLIDSNRETYAANGEIFKLLVDDRRYPTTAQAQQISYRMNAELAAGSDEHLYRIEWLPRRHLLAFQLLGKDEVLPEDESDLSKAWERYIESFIGDDHTKGLPLSHKELLNNVVNQRNLRAVKASEAAAARPQLYARSDLESRICMRSYRMFWQADTEDAMHRDWPTQAEAEGGKDLPSKRKARFDVWLEKRNKVLEEQAAEKDRKKSEIEAATAKASETQADKAKEGDVHMTNTAEQKKEESQANKQPTAGPSGPEVPEAAQETPKGDAKPAAQATAGGADSTAVKEPSSSSATTVATPAEKAAPSEGDKGNTPATSASAIANKDEKDEHGDSKMDGAKMHQV